MSTPMLSTGFRNTTVETRIDTQTTESGKRTLPSNISLVKDCRHDNLSTFWTVFKNHTCQDNISDDILYEQGNTTLRNGSLNNFSNNYMVHNSNICNNGLATETSNGELLLLMVTPTLLGKSEVRQAIRETRGTVKELSGYRIVQVFITGISSSDSVISLEKVSNEYDRFGDIVFVDMKETYRNLVNKTILIMHWAALYCPNAKYVMKVDDDVYVNMVNLVHMLESSPRNGFVVAAVREHTSPIRTKNSKWYVSEEDWPEKLYPPYPNGHAYVMSCDVTRDIYLHALNTPLFVWEDVYVGVVLNKIGIKPTPNTGFDNLSTKRKLCELQEVITSHSFDAAKLYNTWNGFSKYEDFLACGNTTRNISKGSLYVNKGKVIGLNKPFFIQYPEVCHNTIDERKPFTLDLIIVVMSKATNALHRKSIRETWGKQHSGNVRIETVFFIGDNSTDLNIRTNVLIEADVYHDVIMMNLNDDDKYSAVKILAALKWVEKCRNAAYVMKVQDNTYVNIENVIELIQNAPYRDFYAGDVRIEKRNERTSHISFPVTLRCHR
ncbi:beta-1,3-galactosyltransferase 2-like [Glandiceps talaboti]